MTYRDFTLAFLPTLSDKESLPEALAKKMNWQPNDPTAHLIAELGILDTQKITKNLASPAEILQDLLEQKWKLAPQDKDMVVMQHKFAYTLHGKQHLLDSSLVVKGKDALNTAMAQTVGLPLAMGVKLILTEKVNQKGVVLPIDAQWYAPVLEELKQFGITFEEQLQTL